VISDLSNLTSDDDTLNGTDFISGVINISDDSDAEGDSETDEEDNAEDDRCPYPIRSQLAQWAMAFNVFHVALSGLLTILQANGVDVPKDARTLLSTSQTTDMKSIAGGSYHHRGIAHAITCATSAYLNEIDGTDVLTINVNTDGLPLFKSYNIQLWPILGMITELC
jgi:hypothetical protein